MSNSSVVHLPHLQTMNANNTGRLLEDSTTQTQLEEAFLSESKDAEVQ